MLELVIGIVIGCVVGVLFTAMVAVSSRADDRMEEITERSDE